jgi:hypothetical protein
MGFGERVCDERVFVVVFFDSCLVLVFLVSIVFRVHMKKN